MYFYDNSTKALYDGFNKSMQLIPCETTPSAQYSLARNCANCIDAYKAWLCAVTIPRCEDFSKSGPEYAYLQKRNLLQGFIDGRPAPTGDPEAQTPWGNASRYTQIDEQVMPGPYNEILPCKDLCYDLVQSCPAKMQFKCPTGALLARSYGTMSVGNMTSSNLTCSYPGAAFFPSTGGSNGRLRASSGLISLVIGVLVLVIL